jgi:hypothetical protein
MAKRSTKSAFIIFNLIPYSNHLSCSMPPANFDRLRYHMDRLCSFFPVTIPSATSILYLIQEQGGYSEIHQTLGQIEPLRISMD